MYKTHDWLSKQYKTIKNAESVTIYTLPNKFNTYSKCEYNNGYSIDLVFNT